eukprot:9250336-Pyramimonas_sp.AAC.1
MVWQPGRHLGPVASIYPLTVARVLRTGGTREMFAELCAGGWGSGGTGQVMDFFVGYSAVPSSLQMGADHTGRPSGEGWLTFTSAAEVRATQINTKA